MLTVPVTTEVMSLILGHGHGEVYSMQENVIKHIMIGGFLQVLGVSSTNKSYGNRYIVIPLPTKLQRDIVTLPSVLP